MNADTLLYFITALLYFLLGVRDILLRRGQTHALAERMVSQRAQALLFFVMIVHGLLLKRILFASDLISLSLGNSLSLVGLATVFMYWLASFRYRLGILRSVLMLITALLVLAPLLLPDEKPIAYSHLLAFKIHLLVSLMAYGLFAVAALHAVLMAVMEQRLHNHDRSLSRWGALPSLVSMDSLLFQMILVGFVLLTATLVTGVLFSEAVFGRPLVWNHKVVFSFLAWLIYAGLLLARQVWGIRGRRAARWAVAGFILLVIGYLGSKFVVEIVLHRG
ncbi:MAG: cytochrome c biogenesis protein CcsA [Betaproteobacteria bacterium]|jgi:ABC-type uncharacterized transport system, permease component|nr:cytochrome c biogenesis protein CcsA [Betaproteobacteria bacterium]